MSANPPVTGGCLCGAVRYTLTAAPVVTRQCWCRLCQYLSAGGPTNNMLVPRDALTIAGALSDYASVADSGSVMHRHFCPTCGTPVGGYAEPRPHLYVLRIGTLDDPDLHPPRQTIWTDAAPDWATIPDDRPSFPGQPPAPPTPSPGTV